MKYPEPGRTTINKWVEKKTNDKIKDLIQPPDVDASTELVLTNAIYFKGDWAVKFDKKLTRDEPFTLPTGKKVQTPMMHQTATMAYGQTPVLSGPGNASARAQILELPYKGNRLAMVIILPDSPKGEAMQTVEANLASLPQWLANMHGTKVSAAIPRWKMSWRAYLNKPLQDMGMKLAFTPNADFSAINGSGGIWISHVIHQSFVEVNEEGTEAAAATAVVFTRNGHSARPVEFRADRPFLYLIRDTQTGSILFLGRMTKP